jgi:hypothetical protein
MPGNNSWNGKWSGQENKYCIARQLIGNDAVKIQDGQYYSYSFGDGWRAGISVAVVDGSKKRDKAIEGSKGFCGYEWMVNSIMRHGSIICED